MGLQLWYSATTGIRRKGTTFAELQDIFIDNITTKFIYEPLACCQNDDFAIDVQNLMKELDFDILGVRKDDKTIGYLKRNDLTEKDLVEKQILPFCIENIISDSTPMSELLDLLSRNGYVFILTKNEVTGIVTKADINKPIVRIYLFGLISLYELHLNYWINKLEDIDNLDKLISGNRFQLAQKIFRERQGQNLDLTILECLQLCDKKEILLRNKEFLGKFSYSKTRFKDFLENAEKIRNELAHSQSSIIANLTWHSFTRTINDTKQFLLKSEIEIIQ
ncbi:CBS domain-containing protein [Epilithonimonas sp. JDS]|uniref:CBS domain-containing protein n=1 Tax=Epilithonimonas sp. JDS TaxID=2902797 RepID=UPI001E2B04BF|nr:CBS domain-containing protein [Epilithonimonas sp. JDS]MCD9853361.1 CBS domain-containing protein [Epilithonimonas sp. JDS]